MKEDYADKKKHVTLLVVLVVLIVLLTIAIIVVIILNNRFVSIEEKCSGIDDAYGKSTCVTDGLNDKEDVESGVVFDDILDNAFEEKDYDLAANLLFEQGSNMASDGKCDEAMRLLDDERITEFPDELLGPYYSYAIMVAVDCEDKEKESELNNAMEKVYDRIKTEGSVGE